MKTINVLAALLITSAAWGSGMPAGLPGRPGLGPEDSGPLHVAADIQSLRAVQQTKPTYPELARLSKTEGSVTLQINVSKDGNVTKVDVVSGPALLTRAAQEAVRQWKYKPTIINGQPVEVISQVKVNFVLNGK